jgi:hypothetical protein
VAVGISYGYAQRIIRNYNRNGVVGVLVKQRKEGKHSKGDALAQAEFKQNLPVVVEQLQQKYPNSQIEVWFFDEHRIGLKPILKKV